jgi:hypothetical protein
VEEEVVDGSAELEVYEQRELAPAVPVSLFGTNDPTEVIEKATNIANALKDVLGSMMGVTAVGISTVEITDGWKATVEARTFAGQVIGRADAICTKSESKKWRDAEDFARLSMAQTRATAKAFKGPLGFVVTLAGYSATPSEEMLVEQQTVTQVSTEPPPIDWGDAELIAEALQAGFRQLKYPRGKVRLIMGECKTQEDREKLVDVLLGEISKTEQITDAEVVEP